MAMARSSFETNLRGVSNLRSVRVVSLKLKVFKSNSLESEHAIFVSKSINGLA